MKIIQLKSENYKRLHAVEITPDEHFQIIAGPNGQGKSSVLDSIWTALEGGNALKNTDKPIREGEDHAEIQLDLGDLIVTRKFKEGGKPTLVVTNKEGAKYGSPQTMLDNLIGSLSFDPSAFANMEPKKQKELLQQLVGIDFTTLNQERQEAYNKRTAVNAELKWLAATLSLMTEPAPDTPDEEVSASGVLAEIKGAQDITNKNSEYRQYVLTKESQLKEFQDEISLMEDDLKALTIKLGNKRNDYLECKDHYRKGKDYVDALVDPDITALTAKLENVELINKNVRAKKTYLDTTRDKDTQAVAAEMLTGQIMEIDEQKETALREAKFPIEGLSFDDDGILFNGIPFKQCCTTERLKTSVAMAMAMNPTLRIIRIMDGSLLDKNNLAMIEEMAKENDYQVWVELVDDTGTMGIQIEDGEVVSNTVLGESYQGNEHEGIVEG